jgi:hypothetical protein
MATKFASIYKQELRSKGALSSMGSSVLKSARERMDVRNIFFGGKGMLSATGQKMFGRGYSALSSGGMATPSNSQMAAQSAATGELISSNERQEALLRVVAKNTFNMNMMARDMNITRQNIATMTRVMAGQAAQSQDALWYDVKTRNQAIDSLGKKETGPTKKEETKSSGGGIFSNITGAIGSVIGTLGGIGGGILSALSIVARLSPILAIIGAMASAYVIKELGKAVDFGAIGDAIAKFLGIDTKSEKGFFQQILEKLDKKFETTFFTDTKKQIEGFYEKATNLIIKNFGPQINAVGKGVAVAVDIATVYTRAAFQTLADGFSGIGKAIIFLYNEFFQSNKGTILGAIAVGLAARFGPKAAAVAGAAMLGYGGITGEKSREERKIELDELTKKYAEEQQKISTDEANDKTGGMRNNLMTRREEQRKKLAEIVQKQAQLEAMEAEFRGFLTPDSDRFDKYLREGKAALPGGEFGGGYRPLISDERMAQAGAQSTAPTQVSESLSNIKWKDLSEEQKNALLTAQAQSEGYTPGKLPYELKNPGAMIYADWQTKFGGKRGKTVTDAFGITRTFTEFPTHEQGRAAQRWLWDNGKPAGTPGYANMTLLDAFKKWVAPHKEEAASFQNYIGNVLKQIKGVPGVKISEMSSDLNSAQRTFMASSGGSGGATNITTNNNVYNAPSTSGPLASALNMDLMELFA